ncbi:dynamin family protein [Romeria aff. gracilis LEGE 07310]|uniref:Dynamin family protein n=1 Tax=Vasconcelosia minhoensis LEGE 07310 TaxID=915328 RepID=A0A8J7AUW0_9CYAN|nr:dynamin family protein [Romeria aff. gracilis LEGE 07310]
MDYKRVLIALVSDLKRLRNFSKKLSLDKSIELIDDVLRRLEADSFSIAVVGEFKRGKSTFINALLGQDILPSDILPCSATLNRVTYGLKPLVKVNFKDGREDEVQIDQLANYVTKLTPESESTAADVKEATVYYPVHYCQNNVDIIDTPGLNDDQSMTDVTLSVLPQVDAAILVILAQSPLSEYERDFLENKLLTSDLGRIIFVVTAIDRSNTPEDGEKIVRHVEERIKEYVLKRAQEQFGEDSEEFKLYIKKIGKPRVFGLSAYQALTAKQTNDIALLAQSRFAEFETALEQFLTQDRGAIFLQVPVNRAIASAAEIIKTISIRENALEMKLEEFSKAYEASVADISELRQRKQQEMHRIDAAAQGIKQRVQPLISQLEYDLKRTAEQTIDGMVITPKDLNNKKALSEKLARTISDQVQAASQKLADKIQSDIQQGLAAEVDRLRDFTTSVDQVLSRIEMQFIQIEAETARKRSAAGEGVTAAVSLMTGFGGLWSGYREGGIKGAAIGTAASIGTYFGAGMLIAALGLPLTWPALIAVGITSIFTGKWSARLISGKDRVDHFKTDYKAKVLEEIEKQLRDNRVEHKVDDYISTSFTALKQKLHQEVESLLDNTQQTLAELRGKRERDETLTEAERKELGEMHTETQKILGNAQRLSNQLVEIMSV